MKAPEDRAARADQPSQPRTAVMRAGPATPRHAARSPVVRDAIPDEVSMIRARTGAASGAMGRVGIEPTTLGLRVNPAELADVRASSQTGSVEAGRLGSGRPCGDLIVDLSLTQSLLD